MIGDGFGVRAEEDDLSVLMLRTLVEAVGVSSMFGCAALLQNILVTGDVS
ncbi:hypothetical protein [Stackebrandtia nassauensis]|nr:hypothetical protein [Stackebrandtia nassauensis]